jgi:hypothetical protein
MISDPAGLLEISADDWSRRALSLRYAHRRFRDLSPLRRLHCSDFGPGGCAVRGGKRELSRRPGQFHGIRDNA